MKTEKPVIQISATFTAEPVGEALAFWLAELGIEAEIRFSGYRQILQQALDPASESSVNRSGFNVFLIRPEDLGADADVVLAEVETAILGLASRNSAPQLVLFAPHRGRSVETTERESESVKRLGAAANIEAISTGEWTTLYPVAEAFDEESENSAGVPFTDTLFVALATMMARRIAAHLRPPAKVLALDADHTLWGGVCGEDGPEGLDMAGPWQAVRDFARSCRERGVLLCLCSKNSEADVARVFSERAGELGLSREDFSAWRVNWLPKSENLTALAAELNLGIDSVVFLDDNPAEVAEVRANCPGITALTLPTDPAEIPEFLRHLWSLDRVRLTREDTERAEFYRQESNRRRLGESAPSFADFLAGLDLRIGWEEIVETDLARVSQLTLRTNQFNANALRLTESELRARLAAGHGGLAVRVADRFGDYGLVGAMFFREAPGSELVVDGFLLSCRAMGKGVERAMVQALAEEARKRGAERLSFDFVKTDRNEPCRRFFEMIGAELSIDGGAYLIEAERAVDLPLIPIEPTPKTGGGSSAARSGDIGGRVGGRLAERIAGELRNPESLRQFLRASALRPRPEISQAYVRPGRELEKRIARIWCQILELESVGVEDPFVALGGTSLRMVRLHAALRREFDTGIGLAELFELPTIVDIARRLEGGSKEISEATHATPRGGKDDAVAIVGLALRVPGAENPEQFWDNLAQGIESLSRFDRGEIDNPEDFEKPGFVPVKGIIDGVDQFDASFFGILPKDAKIMDPQHRIFLELAWEAMERAGYRPDTMRARVGVYAGAYFDSYLLANLCTDPEFLADLIPSIQVGSLQTELGNDKDYLATRVAFKLNLRGPAMTLQTACSTSMVAIVEACRAIRSGLCDMALAGGVTVTLPLKRGYHYTEQGMLSGDGHCRAFDEKASGTVFGNGAGVVVLKRLSDAVRDRDHIHAVIRGTGLNNDGGVKHSYTAPSVEGQADVIRMAHRDAGVDPRSITYIEAHGTGTPLGDPIEVAALTKAFRAAGVEENQTCAIGSLKPNIGHLDVASGVCGVIKTALSLERSLLPPLLHFQKPNPKIDFANSPFYATTGLSPWKRGIEGEPRRGGVSSFGVGGTNAHVVVEEAPPVTSGPSTRRFQLFPLSARSAAALAVVASRMTGFARESSGVEAADAAWTLAVGRKPFRCRRVVVAENFADLASKLESGAGVAGQTDRSNPPVNFLFPGQGAQHVGMARDFYEAEPRFRDLVDRCSALLKPQLGLDLTEVLFPKDDADAAAAAGRLKHTVLAQPAIFVIEYAMADLWRHWGVEPTAMIGHSVGEFVAACQAGVFTLEDGLRLLADRGRLMGDLPGGGMLSVRLSEEALVERLPETLDLAAVNGPSLCVVAGPREDLAAFAGGLEAEGVIARELHTSHAFHSRMMDPVIDQFADCFAGMELRSPSLPILSSVTGEWLTEAQATDPRYWAKHLRETVRFHEAVVRLGNEQEEQIFIEVGPGQTLTGLARQSLDRKAGHVTVATCRHIKEPGSDHGNALESLGRLWTAGVKVNWENFYAHEIRKRVVLPAYPFERKRHWVDPKPMRSVVATDTAASSAEEMKPTNFELEPQIQSQPVMSRPETVSRTEALGDAVRDLLTELSGIPGEEMAGGLTFLELGFDSLLLTQVSKALRDEFETEITLRQLMSDLANIDAMVTHLDEVLPGDRFRPDSVPASAAAPPQASPREPAPSVPTPMPAPGFAPVTGGAMEALVAQQLELMRQQIALLQGAPAMPLSAPAPQVAPAVETIPAEKNPKPGVARPVPSERPSSGSDVSAPSTTISRDAETLTDTQQRHLDELIAKYIEKTRTSKELTASYRQWYADPRTVSGFNRNWKEMIYQIAVQRSKGSRLLDVDGNEYIDLLNGFGPNFLGHSPDFVTAALHEQLDRGVEVGPQSVTAMEAAKLFCEITGNERASFVNTGSEAVQAAMRLARTVTGRDKVVVFSKDYHGNFDEMLVRAVGEGDKRRSLPIAPGIPFRAVEDVIVLPYGSEEALEVIRNRAHELAAVIVEPIQSRRPEFQPREFIREVRQITRASGTVFVFDEVITGFRTGPRGAQDFYGIEADIATYGKVIGGGMPIGVVAGKAEYMDTFDGGRWQYGDDSFPEKGVTFFAGTFVRHPLAMAATKQVLLHLRNQSPEFWATVRERANRLAGSVDRMFVENEAPVRMPNFGSQMFVRVADDQKYANLMFFHLRHKGVFLLEGFPTYMTAAHSDEDVDYVIGAFTESVAELQEGGFFARPASGGRLRLNGSRLSGPPRLLVEDQGRTSSGEAVARPGETRKTVDEARVYPMTEPLREVWLASQVGENASLCFNEVNTITFRGTLDAVALRGAVREVVSRHEGLRLVFLPDGEGFRVQPVIDLQVADHDHRELSAEDRGKALEALIAAEQETRFDLVRGPLIRAALVRDGESEFTLILNAHHLACDGWSFNLITDEISRLYAARVKGEEGEPALPQAQFGSYANAAAWKESRPEADESETFWLSQLAEPVPALALPLDGVRREEPDYRCGTLAERLDAETTRALKQVAGRSGATLFALLMGAYQALLHRVSRQRRLAVAFPVAGQNRDGLRDLVGHCVNFLPFISDLDPEQPFSEHLAEVQRRLLDVLEHQDFTYGRLLKSANLARAEGGGPLVEAVFNLERMDGFAEFPGLATTVREVDRRYSGNPLFLKVVESDEGLELRFDFQTALYSEETVRHWLASLRSILEKVIANPTAPLSEVASAMADWQRGLLESWNDTRSEYPRHQSIPGLFGEIADARPDATAIRFDGREITYRELAEMSDRVARGLGSATSGAPTRVGLFMERSPEMIATMLAVLKRGAAYVPIDPEYPAERIEHLIRDSAVDLVVTDSGLAGRLPKEAQGLEVSRLLEQGSVGSVPESVPVDAMSPACVFYTSGSTGRPKGAVIPHRAVVRLVKNSGICELGPDVVTLQVASVCFDAAVFEIYAPLLNGGIVALPPRGAVTLDRIGQCLRDQKVNTLWLTSGLFQLMVEEKLTSLGGLKHLLTGGDVVSPDHAARVLEAHPHLRLINGYGPTENTTFTTCHHLSRADLDGRPLPIGRPLSNGTVWILDEAGHPVAPGIPGELCCGGDGVALGYLNQPELTAERFVDDPFSREGGGRLYRSGDLCRYRADGVIEFLGRLDQQVKIRGFRVELGEIEARLLEFAKVRQAAVLAVGEDVVAKRLLACVSPVPGQSLEAGELADFLRSRLPAYLVPTAFAILDELPMNRNGKIDRRRLASLSEVEEIDVDGAMETDSGPTPTEGIMTGLWKETLRLREIGLDDDFFRLGGHSLLGMRLFARIQRTFETSLPLATLFRAPTIRQLSRVVDSRLSPHHQPQTLETSPTPDSDQRSGGIHLIDSSDPSRSEVAETTVAIQPKGDLPPLFAVHGGDGGILFYGNLAERLGERRPFYAFEAPALTADGPIPEERVEETAARYLEEMRKVQPEGPYHLCGYSFGGVVAYEMGCRLREAGEEVLFLGLVDTSNPAAEVRKLSLSERLEVNWTRRNSPEAGVLEKVGKLGKRIGSGLAYRLYFEAEGAMARTLPAAKGAGWLRQVQLRMAHERAMDAFVPRHFDGKLTLFRAVVGNDKFDIGEHYGWDTLTDELEIIDVPGNHVTIFDKRNLNGVAAAFQKALGGLTPAMEISLAR